MGRKRFQAGSRERGKLLEIHTGQKTAKCKGRRLAASAAH